MDAIKGKVLAKINDLRSELVQFHQALVRIPSENPPAKYKPVSKFVEQTMRQIGLKTSYKRHNVIGEFGSESDDSPELIIYGHLDTVEAAAGTLAERGGQIDVLILNAGMAPTKDLQKTPD